MDSFVKQFDANSCLAQHVLASTRALTAAPFWSAPSCYYSSFCLDKSVAGLTSSFWAGELILYCLRQTISNHVDHRICMRVSVRCSWGLQSVALHPAGKWLSACRATLPGTMGCQAVLLWSSKTTMFFQEIHNCEDISVLHPNHIHRLSIY